LKTIKKTSVVSIGSGTEKQEGHQDIKVSETFVFPPPNTRILEANDMLKGIIVGVFGSWNFILFHNSIDFSHRDRTQQVSDENR
jgi:hypothetical protein